MPSNVDLHRRAVEAFNTRDPEALIQYLDPEVDYHPVLANLSGVAVYHGHDGVRSWFKDFEEVWGEEIRVQPEAYYALGEQTLLLYVLHGRGRQSGAEVAMSLVQVATWRRGLIVQSKVYTERDEALADLGISEDALEPIAPEP